MPLARSSLAILASALSNDARTVAKLSRTSGFAAVLFDSTFANNELINLSQTGRREFLHILSSQDQKLVGIQTHIGPKGFSPDADIDRALSSLSKVIEAVAGLRSKLVCVDIGPLPTPPPTRKPAAKITREQAGLIILPTLAAAPAPEITAAPTPANIDPNFVASVDAALMELGAIADRYAVMLALRTELSPFSALHRAIKAANCPWFGVDLCPIAILRDDRSADDLFSELGPLVTHVRARDAIKGHSNRTQPTPICSGSVDWPQLLALLDDADYKGFVTIDPTELPDRISAAKAGSNYLLSVR